MGPRQEHTCPVDWSVTTRIRSSITSTNGTVHLVVSANVHRWDTDGETWRGTGRMQRVEITITNATVAG